MNNASDLFGSRVAACLCFLLYKGVFDILYLKCVGGVHAYFSICPSTLNIICGWLITLIMSLAFTGFYRQNTASAVMLIIFNMFYFIPMTTYCGYAGGSASFLFWGIIYWMLLTALQLKMPVVVWSKETRTGSDKRRIWILSILAAVPVLYVWARYTGFRLLFNLGAIYEVRAEAAGYAIPLPVQYLLNMMPVIIALLMVQTLRNRQYLASLFLLAVVFIDFSIAGHKTVILFPVILIGGYIFYRKNMISLILPAGVLLEIMAIAENFLGRGLFVTLVFRRMGLVLAQLSEFYYRFFSYSSTDLFRQGIIGKLGFHSIYSQRIANVIGNNFETQVVNCNNGLMADAWANLGIIGIFVMPVVVAYCLRLLDFASHKVDVRLIIGIVVYYAFSFANSQWSTVLLTHGFILMCLLLLFFPREADNGENN